MPTHDEEHELDFVNYQEVTIKHVSMKNDTHLGSKSDRKFMEKAAKSQPREDRRGWGRGKR